MTRRPAARILVLTAIATAAVWAIDPWSLPAMLAGVLLGTVLGLSIAFTFPGVVPGTAGGSRYGTPSSPAVDGTGLRAEQGVPAGGWA